MIRAKSKWNAEFQKRLLAAETYRLFLAEFFAHSGSDRGDKVLSYQEFANRAGFASKSFIRDVITGSKRLTPRSIGKVTLGLGLSRSWAEYFELIVSREEVSFQSRIKTEAYFREKSALLRVRLRKLQSRHFLPPASDAVAVFLEPNFPEIYAAMGSVESGASLAAIAKRSGFKHGEIRACLQRMIKAGLVETRANRFYAKSDALDVKELKSTRVFKNDYFRSLDKLQTRFELQAGRSGSLFQTQTFSVSSSRLDKLREELSAVVNAFAADAEEADGDCVAEVVIGFTNTR